MPHAPTRVPTLPVMVELVNISTPREQAIVARLGQVDAGVVESATDARVRAVPVLGDDDRCIGLVEVAHLQNLVGKQAELTADAVDTGVQSLPHQVSVLQLVHALASDGVVLHTADPDDQEYPAGWYGIVTVADLNRPIFRSLVYQMIVILETSLGQLIMDEFGDDWGAIRLLSEGNQKRVQEFWEEERAEGVDLSPVTTVTLSDLFHIAAESNNVWKLMEYETPAALREASHQINDVRNVIMHPVRPLIVNKQDLDDLATGLQLIEDLAQVILKRIGVVAG